MGAMRWRRAALRGAKSKIHHFALALFARLHLAPALFARLHLAPDLFARLHLALR
jgi:hypothetical protein